MDRPYTRDGLPIHLRQWRLRGPACGTVLLVHGLGEHIGRWQGLAEALNAAGWHVAGYDQRGHGASGGLRGRVSEPDSLLEDLGGIIDVVHDALPGPLVLLGHSMGGAVAARFVAESLAPTPRAWWRPVAALALSSPALAVPMPLWRRAQLAVLDRLAPHLPVANGLPVDALCRDPAVVQAYQRDPLVHDRITPRLARFIVDAGAQVRADAGRWLCPTLLMWAGDDRCVDPAGSAALAAAAPAGTLQARCWPGLFHEILREPERGEVIAHLTQWLAGHAAARPAEATPAAA